MDGTLFHQMFLQVWHVINGVQPSVLIIRENKQNVWLSSRTMMVVIGGGLGSGQGL
jgi:hypothetical protein